MAHDVLVLLVLVVRAVRLDDALARDAVNGAGDAPAGNKLGEITINHTSVKSFSVVVQHETVHLPVEEIDGDAKVVGHTLEADDPVALQELLVRAEAHLADEPVLVLVEVAVLVEELLLNGGEGLEEGLVVAVVEAADEEGQGAEVDGHLGLRLVRGAAEGRQVDGLLGGGVGGLIPDGVVGTGTGADGSAEGEQLVLAVAQDGLDLRGVHHLALEVHSLEGDGAGQHGVDDEVRVCAEFVAGEGRERVEQKRGGDGVVAEGDEVQALVGLEAVAAVPVTSALDELLGSLDVLLDQGPVAVEQAHAYDGKDEVDLGSQDSRLLEDALVGCDGFILCSRVSSLPFRPTRQCMNAFPNRTLSPTLAQNSAALPLAAMTSVSPACSSASSSSFLNPSSSFSFSSVNLVYSASSHGRLTADVEGLLETMPAMLDFRLSGFPGAEAEALPSPTEFRMPSMGCARYR